MPKLLKYVTSGDGFYEDGSFIQHDFFAYTAGYGNALLSHAVNLLGLLAGTDWDMTDSSRLNVGRWIFDSFEPFLFRGASRTCIRL